MAMTRLIVAVLVTFSVAEALDQEDSSLTDNQGNPIRKVINMLQAMQKRVEKEGEKEKELYEKFECYCRNGAGELGKSISEAEAKMPNLVSDIDESEAKK